MSETDVSFAEENQEDSGGGSENTHTPSEGSQKSQPTSRTSSNARSSITSRLERPSSNEGTGDIFFSDLTDVQFMDMIAEVEAETKHLAIENEVFFWYLETNDPVGFQEANALIEQAMFLKYGDLDEVREKTKVRSSRVSLASIFSVLDGRGPRVNLVQKSDMVLKAIEEKQAALEVFVKKSHRSKRNLLSELEEFHIREVDITTARQIFEYHIVIEGVDRLTQRIPAEKFLKYMDDWLRSAGLDIEKLRLRTAYMKLQYHKVSVILERRRELRENLYAVDFDKLEIENKNFCKQLDFKTVNMMELKKMFADSNRILNYQKKYVMECQLEGEIIRKKIKQLDDSVKSIENECEVVMTEVMNAQKEYEDFIYISDNYRVPDVMEYVNLKKEHAEVLKRIKVWRRKKNVLDISLRAVIREMMNHTGSKTVDPSWFKDVDEHCLADRLCLPSDFPVPATELPQSSKEGSNRQTSFSKLGKQSFLKNTNLQSSGHRSSQQRISERGSEFSNRISWGTDQFKGLLTVKS